MASEILGVGTSRIRFLPSELKKAGEALTRDDVRSLVKQGTIVILPKASPSRAGAKERHAQKKKGRQRGIGSRKGKKYARIPRKIIWMNKVRAQRSLLKDLISKGKLAEGSRRKVYRMIKGMAFKSRAQMQSFLKENKLLRGV